MTWVVLAFDVLLTGTVAVLATRLAVVVAYDIWREGVRMVLLALLLGVLSLAGIVAAGVVSSRTILPDGRMPGYRAWMEAHRAR